MVRVAAATRIAAGGRPCCAGVFCVSPQPLLLSRCCSCSPAAARPDGTGAGRTAAIADCRSEAAAAPRRRRSGEAAAARPGRSRSACCCRCRGRMPSSARRCSKRRSWRCSRPAGERLTLVPRDTGGTPGGAAAAARSAIAEGATLILGPLLAAEVEAVKPVAARGQDQRHRLRDADPGGRRQRLSDGVSAASGSGARGVVRPRARAEPVRARWRRARPTGA